MRTRLAALFLAAAMPPAAAHVMLAEPSAAGGSAYMAHFHVGHGCSGSPTTALRVEIPRAIRSVTAQPKLGWTVTVERAGGRITAIAWTGGKLEAAAQGSFDIQMGLPQIPQTLAFPTTQTCEKGQENWSEISVPGAPSRRPAPQLIITPLGTPPGAAMPGMHHPM